MTFQDIQYTSNIQTERQQAGEQVNISRIKMRLIVRQKCESYTTCYFKTKNNFILLFNGVKGS